MSNIVAVDVGSSFLKCALYDRDLRLLAYVSQPIALHVDGARVENDPEDWWRAMGVCIPQLLRDAGLAAGDVTALSFCAQMQSVVLVDRDLRAVRRSIGYLDSRATGLFAEEMQRGWPRVEGVNARRALTSLWHTNIAPGSPKDALWKIRWLQRHEPETFARAHRWLDVKDYLLGRCSGRAAATLDTAHLTCLYDFNGKASTFHPALCRLYGVNPALLPEVVGGDSVLGPLLPGAARELGLEAGTAVVAGGGDISCVALGTGAVADGDTHIYLGTSAWVAQSTRKRKLDISHFMATVRTCRPNDHLFLGELETAGLCLSWAARLLALPEANLDNFVGVEAEAAASPVGAKGLLFAPWLHGSRSPNEDPFARGMFVGLGLPHRRGDLLRAVYEGVALHLGWILAALEHHLPVSGALRFVGGGANSPLWGQCLADVTGRSIETVDSPQLCGARGAALLAIAATQRGADLQQLGRKVTIAQSYRPNPENHAIYRLRLQQMKELYRVNRPLFRWMGLGAGRRTDAG